MALTGIPPFLPQLKRRPGLPLRSRRSPAAVLHAAALVALTLPLARPAAAQEPTPPAAAAAPAAANGEAVEVAVPLLERSPFDRVTLTEAYQNEQIDVVLLELPERRVPDPRPTSGKLAVRRLSHPSIPYEVDWSAIAKIELFEQLLLAEAERLTSAGNYAEAFDYLAFLSENYPQLAGLEEGRQSHLWREASAAYAAKDVDQAWPALHALYLRNPRYPRLLNAVQAVSDDLIKARLERKDYAAARQMVDMLEQNFKDLPLTNVAAWRQRFQGDAQRQLEIAREAFAAARYSDARAAVNYARSILPGVEGGNELWRQIQATAPEVRVGVTQSIAAWDDLSKPFWASTRAADLVSPKLVEMVGFGAEGGVYASRWGEIITSDDGLRTTIRLSPPAMKQGLDCALLALRLVEMAGGGGEQQQEDFAALARSVQLQDGRDVQVVWRRPHIRPEAFLGVPLRWLTSAARSPGLWFEPLDADAASAEQRYQRTGEPNPESNEPRLIVETRFVDDEAAIDALVAGEVDVLDRVPPWQLARLRQDERIVVAPYRLPTVHVLIPNFDNRLLATREFRRGLAYGINSQNIVRDILLGGQEQPGFAALSGPFSAGVSLGDPVGYAYNAELRPRPYEPRLAAILTRLARTTLAKRDAEQAKADAAAAAREAAARPAAAEAADAAAAPQVPPADSSAAAGSAAPAVAPAPPSETPPPAVAEKPAESAAAAADASADEDEPEDSLPPLEPLVLAHPADPIARVCCQSIKIQLDPLGLPIKLVEFQAATPPPKLKYDLLYAELTPWEPIVDARRLLGPGGVAGTTGALMTQALDELSLSENWNQASARLKEIHRVAFHDLPMIPLWQTLNHFAYRRSVEGVGESPVSLYQNVASWRKSFE